MAAVKQSSTSINGRCYEYAIVTVDRLASEKRVDSGSATAYHYTYTYGLDGNIATRKNESNSATRSYVYDSDDVPNDGRHHHALESVSGDGISGAYSYANDPNGNMTGRTDSGGVFTQEFEVENRLFKVTKTVVGDDPVTEFYYDADGNRTLTIYGTGASQIKVYTPFPDFEETVPASGATTQRTSYTLAGQLIAGRVRTGTSPIP